MNKSKSASKCIQDNDFESAKWRLEHTTSRYINHWFDTCKIIFNNCKELAKQYVLDPITKTIQTIGKKVKATVSTVNKSHTYLIQMFNEKNQPIYTKIGKANDVNKRMKQMLNHTYKDGNTVKAIKILKTYEVPNEDLALSLESLMRNHFKQSDKVFIPNDRFAAFEPTEEDYDRFNQYHQLILGM